MEIKESMAITKVVVGVEFEPGEFVVSPRYRDSKSAEVRSAEFYLSPSFRGEPFSTRDISAKAYGYYFKQDGTVGQQPFKQSYCPLSYFPTETQDLVVAEIQRILAGLGPMTILDERMVKA